MWDEIRKNAKFVLLQSIFMSKIAMSDKTSTPTSLDDVSSETFICEGPPSDAVLRRWKSILNIYERYNFI